MQEKIENVVSKKFNPEDFGFREYVPARGGSGKVASNSYLLYGKNGGKEKPETLQLCLIPDDAEFVEALLGNRVNLYINNKGYLLLTEGTKLGVCSRSKHNRCKSISCAGLKDEIHEHYGKFRRLYFEMTAYGKGNALLFKPTGKRDV